MSIATSELDVDPTPMTPPERDPKPSTITAREWRLLEDIFEAALQKTPEERPRYLDEACRGNEDLRQQVESLLGHDNGVERVLQSAVRKALDALPPNRDRYIGARIGPYQVVRQLSHGGMSVVYLAIRNDQHYLQTVAIKLARWGIGSEEVACRCRHERQILANLNHPNIAAILDGGSTEDGLPYIVLEYIDGQRITDFCKTRALSVRDRVLLFRSVCLAVHYAHQKLVIHRDIKPSNILVTPDGTPKLLDFGIAKLLTPELVPCELPLTLPANRLMTPEYASPEQFLGESLTTSTDIYSLGVVLFELLTEFRAHASEGLPPRDMERLVCEETTLKPSEVPGLTRRIGKELQGDLDNIVLMALRKEPSRRYKSAEQFADDLSRYLDGRPVMARPDTPLYRGGKFLKRHKTMMAVVAALFIALVVGVLTTVRQARSVDRQRAELRTFVESVIFKLNDNIGSLPQSIEVREALVRNALDYLDSLVKRPDIDPKLLIETARAYAKIAQIQGYPFTPNLGHVDEAMESFQKALQIAQQVAKQNRRDPAAIQLLIEMHLELGAMQAYTGGIAAAKENDENALRLAKAFSQSPNRVLSLPIDDVPASQRAGESRKSLLAAAYVGLGYAQLGAQETQAALCSYKAALAVVAANGLRSEFSQWTAGKAYKRLGEVFTLTGPLPDALNAFRNAAQIRERLVSEHPSNLEYQRELFAVDLNLGEVLGGTELPSIGDAAAASMYFTKARKIAEKLARLDSKNAQAKADLGTAYARIAEAESFSHPDSAIHWYRKSIAIVRDLQAQNPSDAHSQLSLGIRSRELASVLANSGRRREAVSQAQAALTVLVGLRASHPARKEFQHQLMDTHCLLCDLERASGNGAAAVANQRSAIELHNGLQTGKSDLYLEYSLANCYSAFSHVDPAGSKQWLEKSRELWTLLKENGVGSRARSERRDQALGSY